MSSRSRKRQADDLPELVDFVEDKPLPLKTVAKDGVTYNVLDAICEMPRVAGCVDWFSPHVRDFTPVNFKKAEELYILNKEGSECEEMGEGARNFCGVLTTHIGTWMSEYKKMENLLGDE